MYIAPNLRLHSSGGQVENAEVWKRKYGSKKKSHLSVSISALLTHDCAFLAKGDCLKAMHWDLGLQRACTNTALHSECSLCCGLIPRPRWLIASVSGVVLLLVQPLVKNYDDTHISIAPKTFQEHRAHMVSPLTICLGLGLAVTFNSDARPSPRA